MQNRKAAVAGRFYSGNKETLTRELESYFSVVEKQTKFDQVAAIVSPHAGYSYSGQVAAHAFSVINPINKFENVFILAPSHQVSFQGASIYNIGNYETPLGEVDVNLVLAKKLINENMIFSFYNDAHLHEHSLEVQLPFLQYWLKSDVQIVPIVIGTQNSSELNAIAEALKPYFNDRNLFVISSDFSHFPSYKEAVVTDKDTAEAIVKNDIHELERTIKRNSKLKGVSTSACGQSAIKVLMHLTQQKELFEYRKIKYQNSGDVPFGDKSRVVGYWALSVSRKSIDDSHIHLNKEERKILLEIAHSSILHNDSQVKGKNAFQSDSILNSSCGVFVSVYIGDELRGCIGRFKSNKPLCDLVALMAIQSAYHDTRFKIITEEELPELGIELSVISPFKQIYSIEDFELGKHGIYIRQGINSGTFLPQVAIKTGWSAEEFFGHCAKDKVGIGWNGWKNAELFVYTAEVFKGYFDSAQ